MDIFATTPSTPPDAEQPKKYIRTFHSDLEVLKRGGTPDLAPLGELQVVVPTPVVPKSPPVFSPPPPVQIPSPTQLPTPVSEASPTPSTPPPAAPLKTYGGDFFARMKETQATTATVLAAEQDRGPRPAEVQPQKMSRTNIVYTTAGVILLVAGWTGAYIAYTHYLAGSVPVLLSPMAAAPIFVDERKEVSGTGTVLLQMMQQSIASPLSAGSVRLLYPAAGATTTASVFSALQLPAPGALLRNINTMGSMAGVVSYLSSGENVQSPFFVLSVTAYGETFAAMLAWEQRMPRDLIKLFPPYPAPAPVVPAATTTVAVVSTSTSRIASAVATGFFDVVIANHDVRAYRDSLGRDVLLYGYWNQTTLVIARDADAFSEIIGRLATSRAQP